MESNLCLSFDFDSPAVWRVRPSGSLTAVHIRLSAEVSLILRKSSRFCSGKTVILWPCLSKKILTHGKQLELFVLITLMSYQL
jgi:hypothetical protein